jgi:hypothetical protein
VGVSFDTAAVAMLSNCGRAGWFISAGVALCPPTALDPDFALH